MSANNHDNGDPNNVRYAKQEKLNPKDVYKGRLLRVYTNTINKPFSEWIKWLEENGYKIEKS